MSESKETNRNADGMGETFTHSLWHDMEQTNSIFEFYVKFIKTYMYAIQCFL